MVIIEKERMLPVLLDLLDTNSDTELRPLSGLLRNLTRHATDKQHMGKRPAGTGAALLSRVFSASTFFQFHLWIPRSRSAPGSFLFKSFFCVVAAKNMVGLLVSKLPADGLQKTPSSDVVVNLCGALNHLVTCSSSAARDVCHFNGIPKLVGIKTSHDSRYV